MENKEGNTAMNVNSIKGIPVTDDTMTKQLFLLLNKMLNVSTCDIRNIRRFLIKRLRRWAWRLGADIPRRHSQVDPCGI